MELILVILGIMFFYWIFMFAMELLSAGVKGAGKAVKKAVTGKETYFGPAQLKFQDETIEENQIQIKKIMFRGAIPNMRALDVSYSLSLFDITEGLDNPKFVISFSEAVQEPGSVCYQQAGPIGHVNVGSAMTDWVQMGVVVPELIQPPFSGRRKIQVLLRLFDASNPPSIHAGFSEGGDVFHRVVINFEYDFTEKGYEEASQDREEAQSLSLKIGVAVAMADGSLDDKEGETLKNWVLKEVAAFTGEKQQRLKDMFNSALKEGFEQAKAGSLALSPLVERLSEIGEKKIKYDAIELCLDVMAADGAADPEELSIIKRIAEALHLDMDEVAQMREKVTLNLSSALTGEEGLESLVGIEDHWSQEQKLKHLRTEFQKWSNRLNSLDEGDERDAAQNMLDNIASLRKKYG